MFSFWTWIVIWQSEWVGIIAMNVNSTTTPKGSVWGSFRGWGSFRRLYRFFLEGGQPLRNDVTDWWRKQIFIQNSSCIRKLQVISAGGGDAPLHPPPRSALLTMDLLSKYTCRNSLWFYASAKCRLLPTPLQKITIKTCLYLWKVRSYSEAQLKSS